MGHARIRLSEDESAGSTKMLEAGTRRPRRRKAMTYGDWCAQPKADPVLR
jgi:hypothetical protein